MMLSRNSKMEKATLKTFNFDIPAGKTCIGADACKAYCYAMRGFYRMPNVVAKHEANLAATKDVNFVAMMSAEINSIKGIEAVRIHSAGDFYSKVYLQKWLDIAAFNPDVVFYCYTKSIPLFIDAVLPENFRVIYSRGGKYDWMIDAYNLRSCSLVESYTDADSSDFDDSMIVFSQSNIELIKRKVS